MLQSHDGRRLDARTDPLEFTGGVDRAGGRFAACPVGRPVCCAVGRALTGRIGRRVGVTGTVRICRTV